MLNAAMAAVCCQPGSAACSEHLILVVCTCRYKDKLSSMPAADVVRGEAFIEQLAGRMMGQQAQTKAKVSNRYSRNTVFWWRMYITQAIACIL
jgi:hypothetical protein